MSISLFFAYFLHKVYIHDMNNNDIKVIIAVHAKYYAFRLAEYLSARGVLDKIYTIYPRFKIDSYHIPASEIRSLWPLGGLKYIGRRLHNRPIEDFATEFFDSWVAAILKRPSEKWIFDGYSGYCEKSLMQAKRMGAITLVERACPHIDYQEAFMREERSLLLKKNVPVLKNKVHERMKREYEIADYIVVPSEYSRRSFIDRGFAQSKIISVPLFNEKNVVFKENKKYPEQFTVLCVGGHFYRKGIFYLLKAWERLNLTDSKLIIKTEIPDEFSGLYKIPNVEIISRHLSDHEIEELYGRASLFVLPSVDEGFGMVVVEAMRAALPVIVTEYVGAADIIHEGQEGFVVPIRSPEAIAEKISLFYHHPEKIREMGRKALGISKEYTAEKYADRVLGIYKKVLSA